MSARLSKTTPRDGNSGSARYDRRLSEILEHATDVFYTKGYEGASMRDLSRATGMSLAGLYYYFESKEKLLYLIQRHTFETILELLRQKLEGATDPELRLRLFIANHLDYFVANLKAMTVLSHEDEALAGEWGDEIRAVKRQYYRTCRDLLEALKVERRLTFNTRLAVLSLFGMMNWIYTWHNPRVDPTGAELSRQMGDIFLHGLLGTGTQAKSKPGRTRSAARARKPALAGI